MFAFADIRLAIYAIAFNMCSGLKVAIVLLLRKRSSSDLAMPEQQEKVFKELSELISGLRLLVGWQGQLLAEIQKLTEELYSAITDQAASGEKGK